MAGATKSTIPARSNVTYTVHTSLVFSPREKKFLSDISFTINRQTGLITKAYQRTSPLPFAQPEDIDLRHLVVLPGLVDSHTHILLHSYSETPSINQERDESLVERVLRASNHCRTALLAGYTTYRDLGTEGAGDADVHIRDAINRRLIPGPRIFCATDPLASSSGYEIRIESRPHVTDPRLSDPCDGPVACRAGVRRRLGAGADVIKIYADYRKRELRFPQPKWPGCPDVAFPPGSQDDESDPEKRRIGDARNPNLPLFVQEEMDVMVSEAKRARAPVACHASEPEAVIMAANAGVTSVEHGFVRSDEAVEAMHKNGTIFVPTLSVCELYAGKEVMKTILTQTKTAFECGVTIAAGGDTGAFPHGENAREIELLVEAGLSTEEALTAATLNGWKACGSDWCGRKFGSLEEGWAADMIAVEGDPRKDIKALRKVSWVIKDGHVWKRQGEAIGMI
ncbi:Amidohydrolase-like protein 7 [Elsinoe fawcettii]|nr:Amidohydrolase-like protein 7 [Elsinoe fawcettii]